MKLKFKHYFLLIALIGIISCDKNITPAPNCLVKTYSSSSGKGGKGAVATYSLIYNSEGKVISNGYGGSRKSDYIEDKLNLGSDSKPHVTQFDDNELSKKVYCSKNGKVNREEYFSSSKDKYPYSIGYFEYDNKDYHIRTTSKSVNISNGEFTGNDNILEYEYFGDTTVQHYFTRKSDTQYIEKFLQYTYTIRNVPIKTKIEYLYNYGVNGFGVYDNFYPAFKRYYNFNGSSIKGSYVYEFDTNGYLLSSIITYNDNSYEREYDYTYQCK